MEDPEILDLQDEDLHSESRDDASDSVPAAERPNALPSDDDITSGEFVLRTLFAEFTIVAEQKIELVLTEPLERPLSKTLQRGEDPQFDQLLSSLNIVAEYSLLSLLKTLFKWYEKQQYVKFGDDIDVSNKLKSTARPRSGADSPKLIVKSGKERDYLSERRDLAVDFLFCLVLIEILKQLNVYPIDDEELQYIESLAFRHFKQKDNDSASPSAANSQIIAALYAEVIGVLAMARFPNIRKRFTAEFKDHQNNPSTLINLIYGMKYLRIKLFPVEELEEGFLFLRECATLFIDAKDKDIKFAFASMFVEILLPVAAYANRELNVPALKNFVDMMFHHTLDLAKVKRNIQSTYPLVTVLLCVSQKAFFLSNWFNFLSQCLASVRQKDVKIQRIALECLYRLVWVYVIRIKCENNSTTVSRLRNITEVLFPRGAKTVVPSPKDVPLNIFVKIIHFIAQEKLDFAMNDIIFDLLGIGRTTRQISPERMNIGLRAFFVVADNLQRKGGEAPPMPSTISTLPSGNTVRVKKITLPKTLTEKAANVIGLANYYHSVRKALDSILRGLDSQVGKPMIMTNPHCSHKEDDMITGERKPKIDLFRTCIAVIPRCIPEGMTKTELVDFLSRLTMHMDEELRGLAFSSLQTLVMDFNDWREVVILGFVNFIIKDVQDNFHFLPLLDNGLRMLLQLLAVWKQSLGSSESIDKVCQENGDDETLELSSHDLPSDQEFDTISVLNSVEGCALVMLCNSKPSIRRLAVMVLKEVRTIFPLVDPQQKMKKEKIVMDVIEQIFPTVLDKTLTTFTQSEKLFSGQLGNLDILVVNDRLGTFADQESSEQMLTLCSDLWLNLLAGLLDKNYLPESCPSALQFSWPAVFNRLLNVYVIIDPGASGMDSITSLSAMYNRGPKKVSNMGDIRIWRNYLVFACCTHPKTPPSRSESPDQDGGEKSEALEKGDSRPPSPHMVDSLFRFAVPLLKSDCSKIRDSIIIGLGRTSPSSYRDFIEEVHFLVREALDRRAESVRKRRKRDSLRSYLTKVFELNAQHGCFADSDSELVKEDGLTSFFMDFIDGIRLYLESEPDKDWPAIMNLRLHFCNFVYKLITSVSKSQQDCLLPMELRRNLFFLFSSWCAHFGVKIPNVDRPLLIPSAQSNDLELATLHAMCGILQCGPMFDLDGLSLSDYLYSWLKLVLNSPKEKIHLLGRNTLTRLLENNSTTPTLLNWVIDKCYTGTKLVASGCFRALCSVFTKRTDYPCEMIPLLNVVLFKTSDACIDLREKAAQLLQLLERRFFKYTPPSISCSAHCSYSQSQSELSAALAQAHPEITVYMFEEMTSRFQSTVPAGQRCILQYMLPWLANIELVDLGNPPSLPNMEEELEQDKEDQSEVMLPIELNGEGWGSVEATRLVLNNLFYITVKYDDHFSKEIESTWASLVCGTWINNVHEILSYLITLSGVVGQSEVLIHAKKLAVYIARAQTEQTVDELMEELKLTETVASQFERSDEPPYFKTVNKTTCSRDCVCEQTETKKTPQDKQTQDESGKKETKEERKADSLPRMNSQDKGPSSTDQPDMAPLAEPEDVEDVNKKIEPFEDACWPREWVFRVYKAGCAIHLPVANRPKYYAPLDDVLPFASAAASLYRCNFALMVLTELVLDQPQVEWGRHVSLMLHLIFLGLDHGKALVYEHCKRLLVNLIIILVCHGNYIDIAQPLSDFMAGSEECLGKHGQLQKSVWTLDISSMVRFPGDNVDTSAGAGNEQKKPHDDNQTVKFTAGGELSTDKHNEHEQVKSLIEFLANSINKPLWSFEDITPRTYKIKSSEQMEVFLALVIHIFSTSDVGSSVQEDWAKVALHWATTCSSRHYAGRSFQVFRALKVPLSWPMLSDVLSRLVESIGDSSEDVQGYVMEILLTLEACTNWMMYDSTSENPTGRTVIPFVLKDQDDKDLDQYDELANVLSPLSTADRTPLSSRTEILNNDNLSIRHIRSLSSGCDIRRAMGFYHHMGRLNHQNNDMSRARSASVQCLRITNELSQQTQTDMITRVFWIAVSLFESDYDHEYLMAIELLNQVMTFLNLARHESRERLEKVLHRLNWTDFPGLQDLVLKGLTSAGTSDASLRLLARLTEFTDVAIVDPTQVSGFGLNILALLSYMAEHFDEPDEFSRTCASSIIQVCRRTSSLTNLGKMFNMYVDKMYHRPRNTWIEVVCKYIHDSFGRYSKSYVTFLLEVLEYGPQSYQESVLAILCALIKLIDFSSVTMRQFHNDVLRVISKYLKGNYWKESLEILKIAVSNSSNLDTPPPRPPSTVWSSYDSSWAIDAVHIKKELPGRTLEFTYDLSSVPVIGKKRMIENIHEQAKVTPDIPAPRKPNTSQRRTRERLVHVLQTCGHTVGLKQSPSVVFSSSSDLAVEKPSDHQSSSEDINNEARKDDQIMGVLTNFDFLDDVSIESNDESGFVVWPVDDNHHRYDNLEVQSIDKAMLQTNSFSGSDLDLTTPHDSSDEDDELNHSMNEGSVSTTCAAVESESAAESTAESVGELDHESSAEHEVIIDISEDHRELSISTDDRRNNSTSTESAAGTSPGGEYQIYALTESFSATDDVESSWTDHVSTVVKDTTGVTAVQTYALFWSLYQSIRRKFYSLTRECCNYLDEKFREVSQHFCNTLEFLVARGDCPYVCLDTQALKKSRFFDKQKFMTLELHDHYVNYVTKSDNTTECLDCVKLAIKRSSVGSHNEEPDVCTLDKVTHEQRQLDLCRSLYQMHFQFLLLCSTYGRLLESLVTGAQLAKINDHTNKASTIRAEIMSVLEHLPQTSEEPCTLTNQLENLTETAALQQLIDRLINKDFDQAVYLLRVFRDKFGGERFGKSDDDNLDVLLILFCRQTAEKDVCSLVMSSHAAQFTCLCDELMDVNVSALAALEELVFP